MTVTEADLRSFLENDLAVSTQGIELDTPLFSDSRLDSFAMVELVAFLEKTGGFRVRPHEFTLQNLDTLSRILAFADSRG